MAPAPDQAAPSRRRRKFPRPTSRFEREARELGYRCIAGVDEVGRGCLFGPVVAAAVVLDRAKPVRGLADSKLLEPAERERVAARIRASAVCWAIGAVDAAGIDRINIYQAARVAMETAIGRLNPAPDYLFADAMTLASPVAQRPLIGGDRRCRSIAAASIVAKVERDAWLREWAKVYPEYGLDANKGYGTPDHLAALERYGPRPGHRYSFEPVAAVARFPCQPPPEEADQLAVFATVAGGKRPMRSQG